LNRTTFQLVMYSAASCFANAVITGKRLLSMRAEGKEVCITRGVPTIA